MEKFLNIIKKIIPKKIFKALQPGYHFIMSALAAVVCGRPSEKMIVIGVTGTTGKTTSVYLIARALLAAGIKTGYTSTAIFSDGKKEWMNEKKMTMPGRFFTQKILRAMANNGCQAAVIETTSEGIVQYRHRFINYDFLIFTGLYPEHIESHGSFEKYKEAKGRLFKHLKKCAAKYSDENYNVCRPESDIKKTDLKKIKKTIIANGDDEHSGYFLNFWSDRKIAYTREENKFVSAKNIETIKYGDVKNGANGIGFTIAGKEISLKLLGAFNAANVMNAYATAFAFDKIDMKKVRAELEAVSGVAGRLEKICEGQNFTVIVDYAFEPIAVEKLYETVADMPHNKIIHVLGSAGGGRDVARRPILGKLAGEHADFVIITNEDPYDDEPDIIIDQVAYGAEKAGKVLNENLFKILDRKEAIRKAFSLAQEGDVVLITGKGNEQAICVKNGEKIPWDDRKATRELLKSNKII